MLKYHIAVCLYGYLMYEIILL